jgi:hypothetical protein
MSKTVAVYSGILAKLAELFPNKYRLSIPTSLPDNNAQFLADGYGLIVGPESISPNQEFHELAMLRTFEIVFTRELMMIDSNVETSDDIQIQLLEDIHEAKQLMNSYDRLLIPEITSVSIESSSGVGEVATGSRKFLSMSVSFNVDIREQIT